MRGAKHEDLPAIGRTAVFRVGRSGLGAAALVAALLAPAASARADRIELVGGRSYDDVTIVSAQYDRVQYQLPRARATQSLPGERVASIVREGKSRDLNLGREALSSGDIQEAVRRLTRAAEAAQDWEGLEAKYRLGLALAESGDPQAGEASLKAYLSSALEAKDFWVPKALYELGNLQIEREQYESADGTFEKLGKLAPEYADQALVGRARVVVMAKKTSEFQKTAQALSGITRSASDELKSEAAALRGRIFIARKQWDRVIDELNKAFFHGNVREYKYDRHRAEATYLMGLAHLGMGGKENLQLAEIWLLRVAALYPESWPVQRSASLALAKTYNDLGNRERALEWKKRAEGNGS